MQRSAAQCSRGQGNKDISFRRDLTHLHSKVPGGMPEHFDAHRAPPGRAEGPVRPLAAAVHAHTVPAPAAASPLAVPAGIPSPSPPPTPSSPLSGSRGSPGPVEYGCPPACTQTLGGASPGRGLCQRAGH